ncbi:MAG: DUF5908 family protein [Chitinophagales bacterium]
MAIEIRELVIKATVGERQSTTMERKNMEKLLAEKLEEMKAEIMETCLEEIEMKWEKKMERY